MFRLDLSANEEATHWLDTVWLPPARLVEKFGPPREGDFHRITGCFLFLDDAGHVFTVYDYKATTAFWGLGENYPTPEQFWSSQEADEIHIGAKIDSAEEFVKWLFDQCGLEYVPPNVARERAEKQRRDAIVATYASKTERCCPQCGAPCPEYRKTCRSCGFEIGRGNIS